MPCAPHRCCIKKKERKKRKYLQEVPLVQGSQLAPEALVVPNINKKMNANIIINIITIPVTATME